MTVLEYPRAFVILLAVGGFFFQLVPAPVEATANPMPVLSIKLDHSNQQARVTERDQDTVQFNGQVTMDKIPVCRPVVTLRAMLDIGWDLRLDPSVMVITSTTPQSFTVAVTVPQGPPSNITGTLKILGRFSVCGYGGLAEATAIITVDPYFKVELYSKQPVIEIFPGDQAYFTVWIRNQGNSVDFVDKGIENLRNLTNSRWTVILCACLPGRTLPGEEKPVRVTVQSPRDDPFAPQSITTIEFRSAFLYARGFEQTASGTVQLTVHVRAGWNLNLSLSLLALALSVDAAIFVVFFGRQGTRRSI